MHYEAGGSCADIIRKSAFGLSDFEVREEEQKCTDSSELDDFATCCCWSLQKIAGKRERRAAFDLISEICVMWESHFRHIFVPPSGYEGGILVAAFR